MVWKILSFLSAACLGTACFFAWSNQKALVQERDRLSTSQANLKVAVERKAEGDAALTAKQTQVVALQKDLTTAKDEVVKLAADAQEKEAALAVIKGNLEQVTQQVKLVQDQIDQAGDIKGLIATVEKLEKDQTEAEGAVANQTQRAASAKAEYESLTAQVNKLRETEARGRRGIVEPEFSARVSQYFNEWDFAILSKGNSGGVFANSDLDVKRGKKVIAKLKVRNVEQFSSVADLIPGSLAAGEYVRAGDTVVAAATQSAASDKPKLPTDGKTGTTPTDAAPAPGMTAPAPPPAPVMGADPFAAPGATPTPVPAPAMGADPFGAAPAPAPAGGAPAPSMTDPFGPAPTPKP